MVAAGLVLAEDVVYFSVPGFTVFYLFFQFLFCCLGAGGGVVGLVAYVGFDLDFGRYVVFEWLVDFFV